MPCMRISMWRRHIWIVLAAALPLVPAARATTTMYFQTNLTSDIPGLADHTDSNLINPWGMAFSDSPTANTLERAFWISDNGTNVSTLYDGKGVANALIVSTPANPTGQIFNTSSSFDVSPGNPAKFIFAAESGSISGFNPAADPTNAITEFTATDGAIYKGLAAATTSGGNFLYAADFANGKIDMFDGSFHKVTMPGAFNDPNIPSGFAPFNVQNVGGKLYVEYAKKDPQKPTDNSNDPNSGIVDVFDTSGNLVQRLITNTHLSAPWGVVMAPIGFGSFGGDLLISNNGDGTIQAFNPVTGAFAGTLSDQNGNAIVNDGLWALGFRTTPGIDPNTLFFSAGLNDENDGLFGSIQAVPEPAVIWGFATGLGVMLLRLRRSPVR